LASGKAAPTNAVKSSGVSLEYSLREKRPHAGAVKTPSAKTINKANFFGDFTTNLL
jgi:hypothetical protein